MPPLPHTGPEFPYKRPWYNLTLTAQEIEEDMALIISNTKRRPRVVKEKSPSGGYGSG
ncbi:hypothetical protein CHLNCDRAFT_137354 [Chlorella variabilis]|uniref:Uncharacterized protein n=1 Tax=Chlorella variabilis TaxID=554065 RepID=E1ZM88_CHLVA|nr:hypothetical protein CHLNCDRAFT_137354 [Chlorella variabilis]EFN52964.1 hypothetical protein CHLNCDRAFT_137354 [Chlorella variabilis]|eukprot:XP_005845066.1 hypothetical protein CHLNCDRAFT_137354 [Chlorella variabilis]